MSRHLRRIARMDTGRKNRVVPENAWPGGLFSPELHANVARFTAALAAVGQGIKRASDIDHAVALEREAVAAWHDRQAHAARGHAQGLPIESNRRQLLEEDFAVHATAARKIRNGLHHANTPPNAQERGQDGLTGSATGSSEGDTIPARQNAKCGLPKENK